MPQIDTIAYYRLTGVLDHDGNSKVCTRELYMDRIHCIATNVQTEVRGIYTVAHLDFVYDKNNVPINRHLRTSPLTELQISETGLRIHTRNSVYVLERVDPPEMTYQDTADLIELYLNNEEYNFAAGYYYDAEKKPHKLDRSIHVGTVVDSCLICFDGGIVCRYFPSMYGVVFYNTIYKQQDYSRPILIHNVGQEPLRIQFEGFPAAWTILPGQEKTIRPYCEEGADEKA